MTFVCQFVADMASTSPSVRLDLNSTGMRVLTAGLKLGPTLFEKGYVSSPLRHGKQPNRSAAVNQSLEIPVEINKASEALGAQAVEDLVRQLAVDNILKVQLDGAPAPVFFRTFGNADFAAAVRSVLIRNTTVVLSIEAEPFAYGVRVEATGSPFTVSNDPALSNGCKFDVSGVLGDAPSPLLLLATSTGSTGAPSGLVNKWTHIATRRRGTPSNYSNLIQAEVMLSSTDTSVVADAAMSGGSKQRVTFATNTSLTVRLSDQFPENNVATVEARGEYRVYARVTQNTITDVIKVQLRYGTGAVNHVTNDAVTIPAVTNPQLIDLGKIPVPSYADPGTHGFSGVQLKALTSWVALYAQRVSGSGSLDIDYLYFMPADEPTTVIVKFPNTDTTYAIDGTTDEGGSVYSLNTGLDTVNNIAFPPQIVGGGGFPEVIPGATNRIHILRNVDPTGVNDPLTDTTTYRVYYWPRWREFTRP